MAGCSAANSPVAAIVTLVDSCGIIPSDASALRCVPAVSDLAGTAKDFGEAAVAFVRKHKRMPNHGDISDVEDCDDGIAALVAANVAGAYVLSADAAAVPEAVLPSLLGPNSQLWGNANLRFAPLLPFTSHESGMQFVFVDVLCRRQLVSALPLAHALPCTPCLLATAPLCASRTRVTFSSRESSSPGTCVVMLVGAPAVEVRGAPLRPSIPCWVTIPRISSTGC